MSKTVLVVDDDDDIRFLAELTLTRLGGLRVELAGSCEEAIERAVELGPDLILLDEVMPGSDGPTTMRRLRAEPGLARIPVVFMTGNAADEDRQRHAALGAVATIAKPFDPDALVARVHRLLATPSIS